MTALCHSVQVCWHLAAVPHLCAVAVAVVAVVLVVVVAVEMAVVVAVAGEAVVAVAGLLECYWQRESDRKVPCVPGSD